MDCKQDCRGWSGEASFYYSPRPGRVCCLVKRWREEMGVFFCSTASGSNRTQWITWNMQIWMISSVLASGWNCFGFFVCTHVATSLCVRAWFVSKGTAHKKWNKYHINFFQLCKCVSRLSYADIWCQQWGGGRGIRQKWIIQCVYRPSVYKDYVIQDNKLLMDDSPVWKITCFPKIRGATLVVKCVW